MRCSFKIAYFNADFGLFQAENHSKKILKQDISYQLDKGYRLVCELSYLNEIKISTFFEKGPPLLTKIDQKIFPFKYDNSYTNR